MNSLNWRHLLAILVLIKLAFHLILNGQWSFHRDELLYLALGRHLDWGYASVPAGIGFWAWFGDHILGGSVWAIRLLASLAGAGIVWVTGLMAVEMLPERSGRGKYAVLLVGLSGLTCGAFLRPAMMFMPVVFDIFYWTLLSWIFLKWINTQKDGWLNVFGVAAGIGLLNKYSVLILLFALLTGILLDRKTSIFRNKQVYVSALLALLVWSPNLVWQMQHGFPVFRHMSELAASQFSRVTLSGFFGDQLLFFMPALPVWIGGLYFLLFRPEARLWRLFGWTYLTVLGVLLFFNAKSYYSLGAYPVLIAAGAAFLEQKSNSWIRLAAPALMLVLGGLVMPAALPLFPPEREAAFIKSISGYPGLDGIMRWEDGENHALPQDFADMIGWKELADAVIDTWKTIPDKSNAAIYAENYGQAGAIDQFGRHAGLPPVWSFSDNYLYWFPDSIPATFKTLLYVNDELGEDMPGYFEKIEKVWELNMPLSRQHGNQLYRCENPTPLFFERIRNRSKE